MTGKPRGGARRSASTRSCAVTARDARDCVALAATRREDRFGTHLERFDAPSLLQRETRGAMGRGRHPLLLASRVLRAVRSQLARSRQPRRTRPAVSRARASILDPSELRRRDGDARLRRLRRARARCAGSHAGGSARAARPSREQRRRARASPVSPAAGAARRPARGVSSRSARGSAPLVGTVCSRS